MFIVNNINDKAQRDAQRHIAGAVANKRNNLAQNYRKPFIWQPDSVRGLISGDRGEI